MLTSHILADLQHRVDRVAVMASGKVQALGTLAELRAIFDLPLSVQVDLLPGTNAAQAASLLAALPPELASLPCAQSDKTLTLKAPRQHKLAPLRALLQAPQVADVQVSNPSLEDMFFSQGGGGMATPGTSQTRQEAA